MFACPVAATSYDKSPRPTRILAGSKQFIALSRWNRLGLYDLKSGGLVREFDVGVRVGGFDVSADERLLVVGSGSTASAWDFRTAEKLWQHKTPYVYDISLSWDGRRCVIGTYSGKAEVCDARTGEVIRAFELSETSIMSAALSPDGTRGVLISLGEDLYAFDVTTGTIRKTGITGAGPVRFSADGKYIAFRSENSGSEEALRLVAMDGRMTATDVGRFGHVVHIRPVADGGFLVAAAVEDESSVAGTELEHIPPWVRPAVAGFKVSPGSGTVDRWWTVTAKEGYAWSDGYKGRLDFDVFSGRMVGVRTNWLLVTTVLDLTDRKVLHHIDNKEFARPELVSFTSRSIWRLLAVGVPAIAIAIAVFLLLRRRRSRRTA